MEKDEPTRGAREPGKDKAVAPTQAGDASLASPVSEAQANAARDAVQAAYLKRYGVRLNPYMEEH